MPAFRTKAASTANLNIVEQKHRRNLKARRSAAIAKRTSAKAERKQAKQNLHNY